MYRFSLQRATKKNFANDLQNNENVKIYFAESRIHTKKKNISFIL